MTAFKSFLAIFAVILALAISTPSAEAKIASNLRGLKAVGNGDVESEFSADEKAEIFSFCESIQGKDQAEVDSIFRNMFDDATEPVSAEDQTTVQDGMTQYCERFATTKREDDVFPMPTQGCCSLECHIVVVAYCLICCA